MTVFWMTLQLTGAGLILAAFALSQAGRLSAHSVAYLILNGVGAFILGALALRDWQWGFVLLETVWAAVSLHGLYKLWTARRPAIAGADDHVV